MMYRPGILILIACFLVQFRSVAQDNSTRVDADFKAASISEVVNQLRSTSSYRFFYDSTEFNDVSFTLKANRVTLPVLLSRLFNNTNFYFSVDSADKRIFITKNYPIQAGLPVGFWNGKRKEPSQQAVEDSFLLAGNKRGIGEEKKTVRKNVTSSR